MVVVIRMESIEMVGARRGALVDGRCRGWLPGWTHGVGDARGGSGGGGGGGSGSCGDGGAIGEDAVAAVVPVAAMVVIMAAIPCFLPVL